MGRFENDVAIVTGAGSGIGQATTWRLASEGVAVLACDRNGAALEATLSQGKGRIEALAFDVTSSQGWLHAVKVAEKSPVSGRPTRSRGPRLVIVPTASCSSPSTTTSW